MVRLSITMTVHSLIHPFPALKAPTALPIRSSMAMATRLRQLFRSLWPKTPFHRSESPKALRLMKMVCLPVFWRTAELRHWHRNGNWARLGSGSGDRWRGGRHLSAHRGAAADSRAARARRAARQDVPGALRDRRDGTSRARRRRHGRLALRSPAPRSLHAMQVASRASRGWHSRRRRHRRSAGSLASRVGTRDLAHPLTEPLLSPRFTARRESVTLCLAWWPFLPLLRIARGS